MMDQFYISRFAGGVTYLCLRDRDNPWYGHALRRLDTGRDLQQATWSTPCTPPTRSCSQPAPRLSPSLA